MGYFMDTSWDTSYILYTYIRLVCKTGALKFNSWDTNFGFFGWQHRAELDLRRVFSKHH
jgi:hypothetical protein